MKIEVLGIKINSGKNIFDVVVGKEAPKFPKESIILDEFEVFPSTEWVSIACKKDRLYIGTVDAAYSYNTIVFVKLTSNIIEDIVIETYD